MKFSPYPSYKSSGVAWLGDVPEKWVVKASRYGYEIQLGKMLQPVPSTPGDVEVPYLKSQHVLWESVRTDELPTMWASKSDLMKYGINTGDLLVCEGGDVGRAGFVDAIPTDTIIQNALHRVRPKKENSLRLLMYLLEQAATIGWFDILCNRATIAHFTGEKFGALRLPLPPLPEQQAIADFLDRKTGLIDELVGKRRALIKLLREKRSALISRTVTRGLPPEAAREYGLEPHTRFKDSGVEWLGEVPEGWEVCQLRRMVNAVKTGRTPRDVDEHHFEEDGFNWFTPSDFSEQKYLGRSIRALSLEGKAAVHLFPPMTVMLVGIGATIGKVALSRGESSCNQQINGIMCGEKLNENFTTYYLKTMREFIFECGKFTTMPIINQDEVKNLIICVPPLPEQQAITAYLNRETGRIDQMIEKVGVAIERLQEYRTALITAAVTGKIDVRGEGTADNPSEEVA